MYQVQSPFQSLEHFANGLVQLKRLQVGVLCLIALHESSQVLGFHGQFHQVCDLEQVCAMVQAAYIRK